MNTFTNLNKAFYRVVSDVYEYGLNVEARGTKQKEICFYGVTLEDPTDLLISYPSRKFNPTYAVTEWLWYLSRNRSTVNIGKMAKIWDMIKDENEECESNYGEYLFSTGQWDWVVKELVDDEDSRRATIAVNQPYHKKANPLDIPCTQFIQFFIRDNELNMGVCMRSNDVIFGFCNDLFTFALFHQLMYNDLKKHYSDLKLGKYTHNAGSMHIYERHYEMAKNIIDEGGEHYSASMEQIKLRSDITSSYILSRELYLPQEDLSKEQIGQLTKHYSGELFEESLDID
jgi:thymidylate synthase